MSVPGVQETVPIMDKQELRKLTDAIARGADLDLTTHGVKNLLLYRIALSLEEMVAILDDISVSLKGLPR